MIYLEKINDFRAWRTDIFLPVTVQSDDAADTEDACEPPPPPLEVKGLRPA